MPTWLVILGIAQTLFLAFIVWLIANFRLNKMRQRSEERLRILERFDSSQELSEFLNTPSGAAFAHLFSAAPADPRRATVPAVAVGFFILFLGAGLFVLEMVAEIGAFQIPAGFCLILGLGVMLSAAVSHAMTRALNRSAGRDAIDPLDDGRS